jgi:hypothetical protein
MRRALCPGTVLVTLLLSVGLAMAHCDTLDGPVVLDARAALEKGDVTPVLKWVRAEDEKEISEVFARAVKVRAMGNEARDLADRHFLETLVRVHRAGEGMAFTGLKAADTTDPGIAAADKALAEGSADKLADKVAESVAAGIRDRFTKALAAKAHAGDSVAAGRTYVAAYVAYVHYVEAVHAMTTAASAAAEHHAPAREHGH